MDDQEEEMDENTWSMFYIKYIILKYKWRYPILYAKFSNKICPSQKQPQN